MTSVLGRVAERELFAQQREVLFRARRALFATDGPLERPPTLEEDAAERARRARAGAVLRRALGRALARAGAAWALDALPREAVRRWRQGAVHALAFGARAYDAVNTMAGAECASVAGARASAFFHVASSLLDWAGDDAACGDDVRRRIPAEAFAALLDAPAVARRALARQLVRGAPAPTHAVAAMLVVLAEALDALPAAAAAQRPALVRAYAAELASFDAGAPGVPVLALAREKATASTAFVGRLVGTAAPEQARQAADAASALATLVAVVDDLADLTGDLRRGDLNVLSGAGPPRSEVDAAETVRAVIASGAVDALAAEGVAAAAASRGILERWQADERLRVATLDWLRGVTWQWLS